MLSSLLLYSTLFLAAIILIASAVLGGLYLLCRHAQPPEEKPPKGVIVSDLK